MNTIIIRKPKFMRSDDVMNTYLNVARAICKEATKPDLTPEQRYDLMKKVGECLRKAAKAGGFRNVGDMDRWFRKQVHT